MRDAVISSGHQPGWHHPGILAKRIALAQEAADIGGESVWLVADQDVDDPEVIRYPDLDEHGALVARSWRLLPVPRGVPTALRPWKPITPPPTVSPDLPDSIRSGLHRIHDALESAEGDTVAKRFSNASERLLTELLGHATTLVHASELLQTDAGRSAVDRILEDPIRCARIWNEALQTVPRAARALRINDRTPQATEVPAWVIDSDGFRSPAPAEDLRAGSAGTRRIMPRAFLMTAVFRNLTGAPMIHGTGGGRYERVTDQWAREFLELELPPIRIRTGDLLLPLEEFVELPPQSTSTPGKPSAGKNGVRADIRSLEHDPWKDPGTKQAWLKRIEQAPSDSALRRSLFTEMHEAMQERREEISGRIEKLRALELERERHDRQMELARSRARAWPLHDSESLGAFAATIR